MVQDAERARRCFATDPSQFGSLEAHEQGVCRPCSNMMRRGRCRNGNDCLFCHRHGGGPKVKDTATDTRRHPPAKAFQAKAKADSGSKKSFQSSGDAQTPGGRKLVYTRAANESDSLQGHVWVPDDTRGHAAGLIKRVGEDEARNTWCLISTASFPDFWVPCEVARGMLSQDGQQQQQQPATAKPPFRAGDCVYCLQPFTANQPKVEFEPCGSCAPPCALGAMPAGPPSMHVHAQCFGTWLQAPQAMASCSTCPSNVRSFPSN
jgi:hypothetical protein